MDDHWSDSPETFLEAVELLKNKFPDVSATEILAQALEQGVGLDIKNASVFGRMLSVIVAQLQNMPPDVTIANADIVEATQALNACVKVDYSYDLDYLAGYAAHDAKKIYIDRGFVRKDVSPFLVVHEVVEKCLLDFVQFTERAYQRAHQIAQYIEHAAVEAAGMTWDDYQHNIMAGEIKRVESISLLQVPPDLDLTPYRDSGDPSLSNIETLMYASHFAFSNIREQIYHLHFTDAKRMAETLMRFQEFYESPKFKGAYFTREEFEAWYSERTEGHTYAQDWAEGFNFPSSGLEPFYEGNFSPLTPDEQQILNFFKGKRSVPFYIIATAGNSAHDNLRHEIAHALYYLNPEYKKEVDVALAGVDITPLKKFLVEQFADYHQDVLDDEAQAYLSQSSEELKESGFNITPYAAATAELQKIYTKYAGIKDLP